jgi:SPP1 gp7 family putative phage head morphogenesis protein
MRQPRSPRTPRTRLRRWTTTPKNRTGGCFEWSKRSVSEADISRAANALRAERLEKDVTPALKRGIEAWGEKVLNKLGAEVSFEIRNPIVDEYLDSWREQKIVGITKTTRDQVTALMQNAVAEGVGIDEMKRRLRETFEGWTSTKAETVARTEVVGSSNAANLAAYQMSGLVDGKEWLSVQDSSTRETHSDMDGQRRGIRETFDSPSGDSTQGPGLFGIAGEDINCRCTVRPVLNDVASPVGEERAIEWRAYVAGLKGFEDDVRDATAGVIAAWLGDVVQALG